MTSISVEYPQTPDSDYDELPFPDSHHELAISFVDCITPNNNEGGNCLPFSNIYNHVLGFEQPRREVFIPGKAVEAHILEVESSSLLDNLLNPHLYTIELRHGDFHWVIKRRYVHFLNLHRQLKMYRTALRIPLPTKLHQERRSFRGAAKKVQVLPKFPIKPEPLVTNEKLNRRAQQLEKYLNTVLKSTLFRNYHETLTFLEVSHLSFIGDLGCKLKEGMIKKRAGGARVSEGWRACCNPFRAMCSSWLERWLMLKDTFLAIIRPKDGLTREVLLMDSRFAVEMGFYKTGRRTGITIRNQSRKLTVSGPSRERTDEWYDAINKVIQTSGKDFVQKNRYSSFVPNRQNSLVRWFVDGAEYFEAVASALENAKEEIFITDWMLSPELFLKRPIIDGDLWRLDTVLKRKAEMGVKVFVLLYKEIELALAINSDYARNQLCGLHPNIKVIRHPDHRGPNGILFWAHHEKIVVIDQTYSFLGGLDLCFGRWDDHHHRLVDLGDMEDSPSPGRHFLRTSFTVATLTSVLHTLAAPLAEQAYGDHLPDSSVNGNEMPLKELQNEDTVAILEDSQELNEQRKQKQTKSKKKTQARTPSLPGLSRSVVPRDLQLGKQWWPGKDYMNFINKDFSNLDSPFVDLVDRTVVPRMPWHDIGVVVQGTAARDVARHFIQRWNAVKIKKMQDNPLYPLLLPKSYADDLDDQEPITEHMMQVNCQILRSASSWSVGITDTEDSIHQAYIDIIKNAKHFIYIENQFFISLLGSNGGVYNRIATSLYDRIVSAHKNRETFRVYVVMPLLPAFEGEIGSNSGVALRAVLHWNYASICRGSNSLYSKLKIAVGDPVPYLTFYGLRTHDLGFGQPLSELLYVHSKLIIVDDRIAIIGSANINDRSLKGDRDSEIAVIIEDKETYESQMAGKPFSVGRLVSSLRRQIFREHLGLRANIGEELNPKDPLCDPVCDMFFKEVWLKTAARNTSIFEKVFRCVPNDSIRSYGDLNNYVKESPLSETNPNEAILKLNDVKGHLVLAPLHFLCDETLTPPAGTKEALMPTSLWT